MVRRTRRRPPRPTVRWRRRRQSQNGFSAFYDGAESWDCEERIIARVEAGPEGTDTRFIATSLHGIRGRIVYEKIYCARGQAENHIKSWKTHFAADRTSCTRATATRMLLFLHVGAYWLMWRLRAAMPWRSFWRTVQFDTLRLRLIKLAVRIEVLKTQVTRCSLVAWRARSS